MSEDRDAWRELAIEAVRDPGAPTHNLPKPEISAEMIRAAYAVWEKYGVRDVLEIDSDIMRETLAAALSVCRDRSNPK